MGLYVNKENVFPPQDFSPSLVHPPLLLVVVTTRLMQSYMLLRCAKKKGISRVMMYDVEVGIFWDVMTCDG